MRTSDIALLIDEPACSNNANKAKGGCTRPKPGATAGGCSFDGAQITLFPIADVAHIVHGPQDDAFAPGYYSVLFEDPDGVRLEINHVPGRGVFDTPSGRVGASLD